MLDAQSPEFHQAYRLYLMNRDRLVREAREAREARKALEALESREVREAREAREASELHQAYSLYLMNRDRLAREAAEAAEAREAAEHQAIMRKLAKANRTRLFYRINRLLGRTHAAIKRTPPLKQRSLVGFWK
jgi:hypothetical protein